MRTHRSRGCAMSCSSSFASRPGTRRSRSAPASDRCHGRDRGIARGVVRGGAYRSAAQARGARLARAARQLRDRARLRARAVSSTAPAGGGPPGRGARPHCVHDGRHPVRGARHRWRVLGRGGVTMAQAVSDTLAMPAPVVPRLHGRRIARLAKGALGVLILLAAWQISVPLVGLSSYFYPSPGDVAGAFADLVRKGILPVYFADSMARYMAGLSLGAFLGVALGVLIGLHRGIALTLSPLLKFLFAIVEV